MKSFAAVMLMLVALALAVLAFRESRGARQARAEFATAAQERDALRKRLEGLEKAQGALQTENADLRARDAAVASKPLPAAVLKPFTAALPRGTLPGPMEALDSPEMRQLMAIEQKGRLDGRYAALFKRLHLSPEKLDQLKQLLVDRQNAPLDVIAATHKQGAADPVTGTNVPQLIQKETQDVDASIRRLLGDTGYDEFQDFTRTQAERTVVEQLASRLSYSDAPLTPEQSDALVNLLSAERATRPQVQTPADPAAVRFAVASPGSDAVFSSFGPGGTTSLSESTLQSAQSVLSESQMNALRALQAEQQAQQKMSQLLQQSLPPLVQGATNTVIAFPATESAAPHP